MLRSSLGCQLGDDLANSWVSWQPLGEGVSVRFAKSSCFAGICLALMQPLVSKLPLTLIAAGAPVNTPDSFKRETVVVFARSTSSATFPAGKNHLISIPCSSKFVPGPNHSYRAQLSYSFKISSIGSVSLLKLPLSSSHLVSKNLDWLLLKNENYNLTDIRKVGSLYTKALYFQIWANPFFQSWANAVAISSHFSSDDRGTANDKTGATRSIPWLRNMRLPWT